MNTGHVCIRRGAAILLALALVLGMAPITLAAPGDLDPTFGGDGRVTTDFGTILDQANSVAIDSAGRIVVAGKSGQDFAVARYNTDGSLDPTFNDDGMVTTDFTGLGDIGWSVTLDISGRIVVAGETETADGSRDFAVARYTSNGLLDTLFGGDGTVTTDFSAGSDYAMSVAVDGAGRLVVAGTNNDDFAVARYNTDGSLDSTFGGDGLVTTDFAGGRDFGSAVAVDESGRIVVAGGTRTSSGARDIAVARYTVNGTLDSSFDGDGMVITDFSGNSDYATALALDGAGRLVVGGQTSANANDFAIVRYTANGSLDTTFDADGRVTTDFAGGSDGAKALRIDAIGRIVATGASILASNPTFATARYNSNGSLDSSFDGDGMVITDFRPESQEFAVANSLDSAGRIVVAGRISTGAYNWSFGLARYTASGSLDTAFHGDGKVITDFPGGFDTALALAIDGSERLVAAGRTGGDMPDFAVARYLPDGSLDATFGGDGTVTTDFAADYDSIAAIVVDTSGRIVVAGWTGSAYMQRDLAVARYLPNGTLDATFGGDGKVTTDFEGGSDFGHALALDSAGRIVVAGAGLTQGGTRMIVVRYNSDGSLDSTFSDDGKAAVLDGGWGEAVVSDSAGRILVAGVTYDGEDIIVARLNPNGTPDASFDGDGQVTTDLAGFGDRAYALTIDGAGRIVVAGNAGSGPTTDFALVRYRQDGSLDTTFDGDGKVLTDFAGDVDVARGLAVDGAGRIVAAGLSGPGGDFALARYQPDGSLDATFGVLGKVTTDFAGDVDEGHAMALDSWGRIVVTGDTKAEPNTNNYDFALARYLEYCPNFVPPATVGVEDITAIATRWGWTNTTPGWDAVYDLNLDNRIDIIDIAIVTRWWGTTCS